MKNDKSFLNIVIPVSLGELIDKITILEIKKEHIQENKKLKNINKELGPEMKSTGERIRYIKDLKDPYYRQLVSEKSMYLSK